MAAFALDIGHLMLVRNELRNAADAGALAGARQLYSGVTTTGIIINSGANAVASDAAAANGSDASPSEVPLVQRGHWCFGCTGADGTPGVFTANDSLSPYNFMNMSFDQLDADTNYVNAVKVVTARGPVTPAASFFAGIFDKSGFQLNEESVAWLGCEGSKIKVDQPIAICVESVLDKNGNYTCSRGRMINSSGSGYSSGTGAWSNLEQGDDACNGAANANEVKSLAGCDNGAISNIILNSGPMTTVNGQIESAFKNLYTCWKSTTDSNGDGKPDRPWTMTLPLIKCGNKPPGPCNDVIGAIKVEVIWMTDQQDPHFYEVPTSYSDPEPGGASFSCSASTEEDRKLCWASFLSTYKIVDENGIAFDDATAANAYDQKNIVFKPSCELTAGPGNSGGFCANVLAKIPLLVK
ncbi:MAG TPA: pilus assembly protein TadG-related protein [Nitrospirota bacterium]|nr:pilus assembly protein TadG-related protein [Nitrospirota bacterium]